MTADRPVPQPLLARVILVALGATQLIDGLYATVTPRGFYDDFPAGRGWVASAPSYSEHLVRDIGALWLATALIMLVAAVWLERRVVLLALSSWLLWSVPHTTYHLIHYSDLSGADAVVNAIALIATVVLPIWLLVVVLRGGSTAPRAANAPRRAAARVALVERPRGVIARSTYAVTRRRYGRVIDPAKAFAHTPGIMAGYGTLELLAERSQHAPTRLKELAVMRAAMLTGCEWCLDFGTAKLIAEGIPEEDLRALPRYAESDRFSELDRLVLDYASAMTRTPVEVPDELVARLRDELGDAGVVELTAMVAIENLRARFNWALGIASQDFTAGSFCVPPAGAVAAASASVRS